MELNEDETAIATVMNSMEDFLETGKEFYPLAVKRVVSFLKELAYHIEKEIEGLNYDKSNFSQQI